MRLFRLFLAAMLVSLPQPAAYMAPSEFESQEYIWLSWVEGGWLGGPQISDVSLDVMRAITSEVKVRLLFSSRTPEDPSLTGPHKLSQESATQRLRTRLQREGIDLSRVELIYTLLPSLPSRIPVPISFDPPTAASPLPITVLTTPSPLSKRWTATSRRASHSPRFGPPWSARAEDGRSMGAGRSCLSNRWSWLAIQR